MTYILRLFSLNVFSACHNHTSYTINPAIRYSIKRLFPLGSFVVYLYVDGSGSITSVGEERANLSAVVYL